MRKIIILTIGFVVLCVPGILTSVILLGIFCPRARKIILSLVDECKEDIKIYYKKIIDRKT